MSSQDTPDSLLRMRTLLERLEQTEDPCFDGDAIESMKTLLRSHIRAIEVAQDLASKPSEPPQE